MPRIPQQLLNDQPGFYRSGFVTDTFYRANRIFGTEANVGVTLAPGNGVTGFGKMDAGTPLTKIAGGNYAGMYRPAGKTNVQVAGGGEQAGGAVPVASVGLFRVGDAVQVDLAAAHGMIESAPGPFALKDGVTLKFKVNGGDERELTLAAGAAAVEGIAGPFDMSAGGLTLLIKVNRGPVQTITIDASRCSGTGGDAATAGEIALQISEQLAGGRARVTNTSKVTVETDRQGTGAHVEITGGTAALAVFGAAAVAEVAGTGDAADIGAMTAEELAAFIDDGLSATDSVSAHYAGGKVAVMTDLAGAAGSVQCTGGTANALVGFSTDVAAGGPQSVHGLTVTGIDSALNTLSLSRELLVADGDVVRLDELVPTEAGGGGQVAGILENTRSTYDKSREEYVPNAATMGRMGIAYASKIVGLCKAIAADLQTGPLHYFLD